MRNCTLLVAAAATVLGVGSMVLAQTPQGRSYYSPFYNLSLGRSFVPPPSGFRGGIQTGPSGNFLYLGRPDGAVDFGTPWRRPQVEAVPLLVAPSAIGRLQQLSPLPDWAAAPGVAAGIPAGGMLAPAASLGAIAQRASAPAGQNLGMPPGIELPGAGVRGTGRLAAGALGPLAPVVGTVDPHRSARGMPVAGRGINVYMSNNVAVVEGGIRTAADRALLANVLSLEPGVGRVAWPAER